MASSAAGGRTALLSPRVEDTDVTVLLPAPLQNAPVTNLSGVACDALGGAPLRLPARPRTLFGCLFAASRAPKPLEMAPTATSAPALTCAGARAGCSQPAWRAVVVAPAPDGQPPAAAALAAALAAARVRGAPEATVALARGWAAALNRVAAQRRALSGAADAADAAGAPPPPLVLSGHAASLTPY